MKNQDNSDHTIVKIDKNSQKSLGEETCFHPGSSERPPANTGLKKFARNNNFKIIFTKAFDSIHRGKMEQILLTYGLPKETIEAIMMLNRNTKVKVCSPGGDTDYFDIVAGVLQGDTLAPYLCLDYVLRTSIDKIKENSFKLTKERSRKYPAKTITDADYTNHIALLANAPAKNETLLHSLEQAAAGIGLRVNAHKMEYMCFNQKVTSPH